MTSRPDLRRQAWDEAYAKRQNFLFYPNEKVIRFVSANFRKQIAPDSFAVEKGTVQSYFNFAKMERLLDGGGLALRDAILVRRESVLSRRISSRYHLTLEPGA